MKPLQLYLAGTATWFISHGIQTVLFAWLVTLYLHESADKVGLAQMANLIPATFLLLIGGAVADIYGPRRILVITQLLAALPPLFLIWLLATDNFDFRYLIVYALTMGSVQAMLTPARDGLLNQVAGGRIQRTVILASMTQFGVQALGFGAAALADTVGAIAILSLQVVVLLFGATFYRRIPDLTPKRKVDAPHPLRNLLPSLAEGYRTVVQVPVMRAVLAINCAMGIFFMGSYVVTLPLLVRDIHGGSAMEIAILNGSNALGLLTTIFALFWFGDVARKGRALVLAHVIGALCLCLASMEISFALLAVLIFAWGAGGGVAMSMSRTIMQELAPDAARGRVMAFFSLSFMGAGPLGALLAGYLASIVGVQSALLICASSMAAVVLIVAMTTSLWGDRNVQLRSQD